ncbi:HDOD domain-containing protein [Pseudacidovorax intermedius]|uniref:HDOD domain-containing protein n=1 Tax=Pseudacidovorax intermedius TaxID=433924 RepID=A0A147GRB1_9BURK|nr:HDOD domain-containing protein [Pseudacidovorax intermedius]KTT18134.1 hypothetical protein NS331_16225 [Pseudacidovorax intermedius]
MSPMHPAGAPARPDAVVTEADGSDDDAAAVTLVPPVVGGLPETLASFQLAPAETLLEEQARRLGTVLREIPPPPRALRQLVSPDFVASAGAADLADLVMGEPLVAAKVMAAVNSPLYGVRQPVTSISQAITFLGMTVVRNICLRHMMGISFNVNSAYGRRALDTLDASGGLAGALCLRLAPRLPVDDPSGLATQVVISFIGHLAAITFQHASRAPDDAVAPGALLPRLRLQQAHWGVSAGAIGQLLMREWKLPPGLAQDAWALESVLVTPVEAVPPRRAPALALGYVCARLGERLACGQPLGPQELDQAFASDPDFHHVRAYLDLPALADLPGLLRDERTLEGLRT